MITINLTKLIVILIIMLRAKLIRVMTIIIIDVQPFA